MVTPTDREQWAKEIEESHSDVPPEWESRLTTCKGCGAPIIWLKTEEGKNIPTNPAGVLPEHTTFIWGTHEAHFKTCPNAREFRRRR